MSRLDSEFEQLLGSWLDHCAESILALPPAVQISDAAFLDAAKSTTIERFKVMIPDNMEKLREIHRVLLVRLRKKRAWVTSSSSSSSDNSGSPIIISGEEHLVFEKAREETENNSDDFASSAAFGRVQQVRQVQFIWLLFDCLLQTVPLLVVTWCAAVRNGREFFQLAQENLPWLHACAWCDALVSGWEPLFRAVDRRLAADLSKLARDKRTAIVVAQNMAAEQRARQQQDEASAATRNASAKEVAELQELAQRLVAALQKHKPGDGRTMNVKLESGLVKQEMAAKLQAGAAQLSTIGNTADTALDVDEEYEPTYVEGAVMHSLVKDEVVAADGAADGGNKPAAKQAGGGGRREARKRPR